MGQNPKWTAVAALLGTRMHCTTGRVALVLGLSGQVCRQEAQILVLLPPPLKTHENLEYEQDRLRGSMQGGNKVSSCGHTSSEGDCLVKIPTKASLRSRSLASDGSFH